MKKFAFLIHFRHSINADLSLYFKPLKNVPEKWCEKLFDKVEFPSMEWSHVQDEVHRQQLGINEVITLSGQLLLKKGPKNIQKRIDGTIDKLADKGFDVIGLGALTAPLTLGGKSLTHRKDVAITNGNAYTAVTMRQAAEKLMDKNDLLAKEVAIVGASGSVGSCLARQLVQKGQVEKLILVARNQNRLDRLVKELKGINSEVVLETGTSMDAIRKSKLVVLLTTSVETILKPSMLCGDCVVLDGTQPRNTQPGLIAARPDVTVIDGGVVSCPGISMFKGGFGLPAHNYFACFSETALLAIDGQSEHFSIGNPTLENAEHIEKLATKHANYGFELAPFLSFGKPLNHPNYH